ncbi:Ryanodine receptor 2, partial [Podiceps cristatus]
TLQQLISDTMVRWAQESVIEDPELVRAMFVLLHRQYDGIGGLVRALPKTYTINSVSVEDTINLLASLGQIRSLLSVRMGKEEEKLMIRGLGPHQCSLVVPMLNVLFCFGQGESLSPVEGHKTLVFLNPPLLIPWSFLRQGLSSVISDKKSGCRLWGRKIANLSGCSWESKTPIVPPTLDIPQAFCCMTDSCRFVVRYLAGCGLQSCPLLISKGYPDIGWNPVEGERYLDFLRFAVFCNGESVEENANVVVRLLIR